VMCFVIRGLKIIMVMVVICYFFSVLFSLSVSNRMN